MSDEEVLRIAAIAAVLSLMQHDMDDSSEVGRQLGLAWSQDHRRMNTGQTSLLRQRTQRAPWRP